MTYPSLRVSPRPAAARRADVAGIAWPVYKLEALAIGLMVFAVTLVAIGSLQGAVLGSAAVTVAAWWVLRLTETHLAGSASARQAAGPQ